MMSLPKFSRIQKFIIRWKTRSLGEDIDVVILVLSVLVYMGRANIQKQLDKSKEVIDKKFKAPNMAHMIFERVVVEVAEFTNSESEYIKQRDKAFSEITQDIQLYLLVIEMLGDVENASNLNIVESVIQKAYDEKYSLTLESKRILESQEKNIS